MEGALDEEVDGQGEGNGGGEGEEEGAPGAEGVAEAEPCAELHQGVMHEVDVVGYVVAATFARQRRAAHGADDDEDGEGCGFEGDVEPHGGKGEQHEHGERCRGHGEAVAHEGAEIEVTEHAGIEEHQLPQKLAREEEIYLPTSVVVELEHAQAVYDRQDVYA